MVGWLVLVFLCVCVCVLYFVLVVTVVCFACLCMCFVCVVCLEREKEKIFFQQFKQWLQIPVLLKQINLNLSWVSLDSICSQCRKRRVPSWQLKFLRSALVLGEAFPLTVEEDWDATERFSLLQSCWNWVFH